MAQAQVCKALKTQYNRYTVDPFLLVDNRIYMHMPGVKQFVKMFHD